MSVTCELDAGKELKRKAVVFTVATQMLRSGVKEERIKNYIKAQKVSGTDWGLSGGKLIPNMPAGSDFFSLIQKALADNLSAPDSGLIPVLKRTNEKALKDMVARAEGEFVNVSGYKFFKPYQSFAREWTRDGQSWDIIEKGITPTVIPIRVWGWDEHGKKLEGTRNTKSAILHVNADIWEESGLATALQHLIDNTKVGDMDMGLSGIRALARKVQREALSYRESDGARTSQKVLFRDKNLGKEPVPESELMQMVVEVPDVEEVRQEDYFTDDYEEPSHSIEEPGPDLRQENADLANAGWDTPAELITEAPPPEPAPGPKQTLEQVTQTISVLAPSIPRLEGFRPYLEALKDPVEAEAALESLILQNSELANDFQAAMYELHQQGELSEATLNKLLKGPCS